MSKSGCQSHAYDQTSKFDFWDHAVIEALSGLALNNVEKIEGEENKGKLNLNVV